MTGTPGACGSGAPGGRNMECLDRGVIAVPSDGGVFVSFRLLGTEPDDLAFRVYRQSGGGTPELVCELEPDQGTSCLDENPGSNPAYFVRALSGGVEGEPSAPTTALAQDYLRIPLAPAPDGAFVHLAWVGDLDGDGGYDIVVDRLSADSPKVDGYSARTGELLWRLDTGPLGVNQDNIEGGASTISNGHWDGVTVFDFDSDGFAEVAIKTANGFVFGDGGELEHDNDQDQFVSIVDGRSGAERARAPLPDDYQSDGPLQCHFGVGYFDGVNPSVVTKCKNRVGSGAFNLVAAAYDFDGTTLTRRWKFVRENNDGGADYHQIRVLDVDGDGKDELADGGYVIDDDGSMLYALGGGVVHGDRFHITDMDPARPGLEGFGIQQDNPNGLETYYYDARTGELLRTYENPNGAGADMGRGTVADLFADEPGYEYWSFNGMYSAGSGDLVVAEQNENVPWPNFLMQWDGDVGSELLDNNRVGDWDIGAQSRNTYSFRRTFEGLVQARGAIPFYGDIFGDWREEALLETADHGELRIYTTTYETDVRLYTLAHNPAYRNSLTVHGYKQSHLVDYYLGFDMSPPAAPNIRLVARP
jgi:rhamnogalacturonan endolyase